MKIKVIVPFFDKFDRNVQHKPGDVIDIKDKARAEDIIARGLGEVATECKSKNGKS